MNLKFTLKGLLCLLISLQTFILAAQERMMLSGQDWTVIGGLTDMHASSRWKGVLTKDEPLLPLKAWPPFNHPPIQASVPGNVQDDLLQAGLIEDPYVGLNSMKAEWISDRSWLYYKTFHIDEKQKGKKATLHFEGVDFECVVYLNGKLVARHADMFEPFDIDITAIAKYQDENRLVVIINEKPDLEAQSGYTSKNKIWKPRFAYWWDFSTRLVPLGIYDDVWIDFNGQQQISDVWARSELKENHGEAEVFIDVTLHSLKEAAETEVILQIKGPKGKEITLTKKVVAKKGQQTIAQSFKIKNPLLWWPNGTGEPHLYEVQAIVQSKGVTSDAKKIKFGIRSLDIVDNEGAPEGSPPYTLVVNGKKIFMKGWNWVPADQLYGRVTDERYEKLIGLAKDAHCNMLRVWGGGLIEKRKFYSLCDEMGIMVWQEFIQCVGSGDSEPSTDPDYLEYIERMVRQIVPRRRNHPSLMVWCGGNELRLKNGDAVPMDHPTNVTFKKVLDELDPNRIFLATSPTGPTFCSCGPQGSLEEEDIEGMHDVHCFWNYEGPNLQYQHYNKIDPLLHSEFGVDAVSNLSTALRVAPKEKLWPPDQSNYLWLHHGSWWLPKDAEKKKWDTGLEEIWGRKISEYVWGDINKLEELIAFTQFQQADGLRYGIESHRRSKFRTSGVFPWQFNEPWPNLSCTNAVDYYLSPRPAYYWVKKAYAPVNVSLMHQGLDQSKERFFKGEVWLDTDLNTVIDGTVTATVYDVHGNALHQSKKKVSAGPNTTMNVFELEWPFSTETGELFVVRITWKNDDGGNESSNTYLFSRKPAPTFEAWRTIETTEVQISKLDEHKLTMTNTGSVWALGVWLDTQHEEFDDNYFFLAPGETKSVYLKTDGKAGVNISWWNK